MFTVKAPRLVTHFKKFLNAKRELNDFYTVVNKGLKEKLGPILFQLPPNFAYSEENLERLLISMNQRFINVIEFRHETWWRDDVYKTLKENNLTFCSISYPGLPDDVVKTAPVVYYRFHGVPQLYRSPYSLEVMEAVVSKIRRFRGVASVYIYFNNDIDVSAIDNARDFQKLTMRPRSPARHPEFSK